MIQADLFAAAPAPGPETPAPGVALWRGFIAPAEQRDLLDAVAAVLAAAPPRRPRLPNGLMMVNAISNCGAWGWWADAGGYRYVAAQPGADRPWPPIPKPIEALGATIATAVGIDGFAADSCLVNLYAADGRLGAHQDRDEADVTWPIVSVSLGASCRFALGGATRRAPVRRLSLASGDVLCLHGPGRLLFHGVDRILDGTAPIDHPLLTRFARINLTLRRAR